MSRFILIALFLVPLVLPLTACWEKSAEAPAGVTKQELQNLIIQKADGTEISFEIEIAATQKEQAQGLMNRTSLAENAGMLFIFNDDAERGFWMKNTLIPLDMIFIRADGKIHRIHENAVPEDLTTIYSQGPVAAVLEINGGLSSKIGLKKGDIVKHPYFAYNLAQ